MEKPPQWVLADQRRTQAHATEGIRGGFLEEEEEEDDDDDDDDDKWLNGDPWRRCLSQAGDS